MSKYNIIFIYGDESAIKVDAKSKNDACEKEYDLNIWKTLYPYFTDMFDTHSFAKNISKGKYELHISTYVKCEYYIEAENEDTVKSMIEFDDLKPIIFPYSIKQWKKTYKIKEII